MILHTWQQLWCLISPSNLWSVSKEKAYGVILVINARIWTHFHMIENHYQVAFQISFILFLHHLPNLFHTTCHGKFGTPPGSFEKNKWMFFSVLSDFLSLRRLRTGIWHQLLFENQSIICFQFIKYSKAQTNFKEFVMLLDSQSCLSLLSQLLPPTPLSPFFSS